MQELFYPEIQVDIGRYSFSQGLSLQVCSDKRKPYDWGILRFTEEYQPRITLEDAADITVRMGYAGDLQDVFYGNLYQGYNHGQRADEIFFKDRMLLLEQTSLSGTYLHCIPQDIIEDGLRKAGIKEYKLSPELFAERGMVTIRQKNMVEVLQQINTLWGVSCQAVFLKGVFYWGVKPVQTDVYEFEYANNIIALDRDDGLWELTTVAMPFLQHSQTVSIIHPKISGEFEIEKVISVTNFKGFTRSTIYFAGG